MHDYMYIASSKFTTKSCLSEILTNLKYTCAVFMGVFFQLCYFGHSILKQDLVVKFASEMSSFIRAIMPLQVNVGQSWNSNINLAKKCLPLLALLVLKHPLIQKISLFSLVVQQNQRLVVWELLWVSWGQQFPGLAPQLVEACTKNWSAHQIAHSQSCQFLEIKPKKRTN